MTEKAHKLYDEAEITFEEYEDGSLDVDMLFNYSDLLKYCTEDLLETFDVSYNTEVEFYEEADRLHDEPPYSYKDPTVIWTPRKQNLLGKLMVTCRGYEFENDLLISCYVMENNEKQARLCASLLTKYWI